MPLASIPVMSNPLDRLKHQRDYDGKGGDHDVKRKGFAADTTQHTHITNPGEATNQQKNTSGTTSIFSALTNILPIMPKKQPTT
jgi:hypothetical protein